MSASSIYDDGRAPSGSATGRELTSDSEAAARGEACRGALRARRPDLAVRVDREALAWWENEGGAVPTLQRVVRDWAARPPLPLR